MYKTRKIILEKILKEKLSPHQVLVINKHRDCQLSDVEIRQWAEEIGIKTVIIQPLFVWREGDKDQKHLAPLAL